MDPRMAAVTATHAPEADDALVARVLAGDSEAFGALVRRHQRAVWGVAAALLDRAAAENLVQQCFVTAYERLHKYQMGRDFGAWLNGIARNLVWKALRTATRETRGLGRYREHLLAVVGAAGELEAEREAEVAARWERSQRALRGCREALAPAAARALSLRYEQGLSLEEIAQALGRTVVATRQLLFRTRLALRACLDKALSS
jgi:RNA polymerase sigma-70 factor (ECF subfamily)